MREDAMASVTPDRKNEEAFDQAGIEILSTAFRSAWLFVERDAALRDMAPDNARPLLARRIIVQALQGEGNPTRLANDAIAWLREREQMRRSALRLAEKSRALPRAG
jgi:hypothetical protein